MTAARPRLRDGGLVPFFARGIAPKYSTINATVENLESGASWRGPWKRGQRCIIPATGFYEPHIAEDGRKQQFYIHAADQENFGIAGIWDRSTNAAGESIDSFALITLPASPLLETIHNEKKRMPAILAPSDADAWLRGTPEQARATLKQYPDDLLVAWRVSDRVNNWRNNDAGLIGPAPP